VSPSRTETTEAIKSVPRLILGGNERTVANRRCVLSEKGFITFSEEWIKWRGAITLRLTRLNQFL
jgi:hypothetical protein